MIVYGTGSKDLGEKLITNEKCPHCGEFNKIHLHGIARYFDVFWIPIFPFKKKIIAVCHNCDTEIPKKEASPSLIDKISLEKSSFKIPIYLFSGLILIVLAIGFFQYSSSKHKSFVESRVENIQKNDILVFKHNMEDYTFAKVDSIYKGAVFFKNSNYSYNKKPSLSDYNKALIDNSDFFDSESYYYTINEIDSLHKNGVLDIFE
ncbi:MAG TPA: zinc-ribbon domain-containing protein [Lutibacter sp.]|nr:zinc-ribbon domain-containing protein [Lutibacter sp.]